MLKKAIKTISFLLIFSLIVEQTGFAQVAGQLDVSGRISAGLSSILVQDKFRPLHLRYLSYNPQENNYQLLLDKGSLKDPSNEDIENTAKELLKYFLIGITLPNDAFWVNLRPDAVNNIIDENLAKTDLGKILLEADIQLKKDTARYASPQTIEGREYWDKLYEKAEKLYGSENVTIPTLNRPWIVPDEIIVRESQGAAYIYKATLKVMLEEDYLKDSQAYKFKDERSKMLNEYSAKLLRETIIPKITKEINSSKRYAALRQVYYSLILAQWFKQAYSGNKGLAVRMDSKIESRDLTGLTSRESWSKDAYYQAYQKSFKEGEYNIKEPRYTANGQVVRSYVSGGIVLQLLDAIKSSIVTSPVELSKGLINKCYSAVVFENGQAELRQPIIKGNKSEDAGQTPISFGTNDYGGIGLARREMTAIKGDLSGPPLIKYFGIDKYDKDEKEELLINLLDIEKEFNQALEKLKAAKIFKSKEEANKFLKPFNLQVGFNSVFVYRTIQVLIEAGVFKENNQDEILQVLNNLVRPCVSFELGRKKTISKENSPYPAVANRFIEKRFADFDGFIKEAKTKNIHPVFLEEQFLVTMTDRRDLLDVLSGVYIFNDVLKTKALNEAGLLGKIQSSFLKLQKNGAAKETDMDIKQLRELIWRVVFYSSNPVLTFNTLKNFMEIGQKDVSLEFIGKFSFMNEIGQLVPGCSEEIYELLLVLAENKLISGNNIEAVKKQIKSIFDNIDGLDDSMMIAMLSGSLLQILKSGVVTQGNFEGVMALFNRVLKITNAEKFGPRFIIYHLLRLLVTTADLDEAKIKKIEEFLAGFILIKSDILCQLVSDFFAETKAQGAEDIMWELEFLMRLLPIPDKGDLMIVVPDSTLDESYSFRLFLKFFKSGNIRKENLKEVEFLIKDIKDNILRAHDVERKMELLNEISAILDDASIDKRLKAPGTFKLFFDVLDTEFKENGHASGGRNVKKLTRALNIFRNLTQKGIVNKDNLDEFKELLVAAKDNDWLLMELGLLNTKTFPLKMLILVVKNLQNGGVRLLRDLESRAFVTKENLPQVEAFLREFIRVVTGHDADDWQKQNLPVKEEDVFIDPLAETNEDEFINQGDGACSLLSFFIQSNSFSVQDFPAIIALFKLLADRNNFETFKKMLVNFQTIRPLSFQRTTTEIKFPYILELIDALRIVSISKEAFDAYLEQLKYVNISEKKPLEIIKEELRMLPGLNKNYLIYLIEKGLREKYQLKDKDIENEFLKVNNSNYLQEPFSIYLYLKIRKDIPFSIGLSYEEFKRILKGEPSILAESRYTGVIMAYVAQYIFNEAAKLSPEQQKEVIELSIDVYKKMLSLAKEHSLNDVVITFRELIRFNIDFSRYYLAKGGANNVIEYFILTSFNIYGRVIKNEDLKRKFCSFIKDSFSSYPGLFGQAQVNSNNLREREIETITKQLVEYGDYEDLTRTPKDNEVPLMVSISAFIKRAAQVSRPLLLALNSENSLFFIEVLKSLTRDKNNIVITLPANRFTRRQEFFGMYLPKEQLSEREIQDTINSASDEQIRQALKDVLGLSESEIAEYFDLWQQDDPEIAKDRYLRWAVAAKIKYQDNWKENFAWAEGALVKLVHQALNNPDKKYYFVIENIEACPDRVRVLFNPVLWEKIVEIPEKGTRLALPSNLHFLFTKHQDSQIKDAAFMDRFIIQNVMPPSRNDLMSYLIFNMGLSGKNTIQLLKIFQDFQELKLGQEIKFCDFDLIEIAKRVKGLAQDGNLESLDEAIVAKEAYDYLYLRLRNMADKEKLKSLIVKDYKLANPSIEIIGDEIIFDGVKIKATKEFLDYARENPGRTFAQLITGFYDGFVVTELEMRVFSQMARALRYGSKVVQLEGPSGEGKTEIGRVFSRIINFSLQETTVNEGTDTSEFIGRILPGQRGYHLSISPYLTKIEQGNNLFLINEINTSLEQGVYYLLFNEIAGLGLRYLTQFPLSTADDSILKMARISQNNLWLFTVNPDNFQGRESTPPIVSGHIPVFYMAQDIEQIPQITEEMFRQKGLDTKLSSLFAEVHKTFKDKIKYNHFDSRQDVTRRELIRAVERFSQYIKTMPEQEALEKAISEVYIYMWLQRDDIDKAREIIKKILAREEIAPTSMDSLEAAIRGNQPVLVVTDGTNDRGLIQENIKRVYPEAEIISVPVSYFHRERQLLGGLVPRKSQSGAKAKLGTVQPKVDNGLGILPGIIKKARFAPEKTHFVVLHNYTHINPKVAPLLNEFLQTGKLQAQEKYITLDMVSGLARELKDDVALAQIVKADYQKATGKEIVSWESLNEHDLLDFGCWFYSNLPENIRIIASGSSEEKIYLSQAELDRFLPVNISQGITEDWIEDYISKRVYLWPDAEARNLARGLVLEIFKKYQEQKDAMFYDHNRLSKQDIDVFLKEVEQIQGRPDKEKIKKLAYYILAAGLRSEFRSQLSFKIEKTNAPEDLIRYEKRKDGVYLIVDLFEYKTKFKEIPEDDFLASTQNLVMYLASMLLAVKYNRPILLEGNPGGGKTSLGEELAKRLGIDSSKILMYEDIDLGPFLGQMSLHGDKIILTSDKINGRYVLDFLRVYSEGGIYILDEGAIGMNSQEAISFLVMLSEMDEINLGMFHPGLKDEIIKKHRDSQGNPDFYLVVTQNPARTTRAREPIPYSVDNIGAKVWVDNVLEEEDALRIIDYYLKDINNTVPPGIKLAVAKIHNNFTRIHPNKEELSPRQLIMVASILKDAMQNSQDLYKAAFMGIVLAYLGGASAEEFAMLWNEIEEDLKLADKAMVKKFRGYLNSWKGPIDVQSENNSILFNGIRIPKSQKPGSVNQEEVFLSEKDIASQNKLLRAMALLVSLHMPIALLEEDGADALDLARKFAYLTGYQLHTFWSHPQMSRMQMLSNILPKFSQEFDKYGIKPQDLSHEFILGLGFLLRHMITEEEYSLIKNNQQAQEVLFFNFFDAIPERQRVVLNEILTTKKITIQNEKGESVSYILPEWVHIMVSSQVEHKFSSAFINRFIKLRVSFTSDIKDLKGIIQKRYPLIRDEEVDWINMLSNEVSDFDKDSGFGIGYGFSQKDMFNLAMIMQLEKQDDIINNKFSNNPFYYFMKAAYAVYYSALEEYGDREKFESKIIKGLFLSRVSGLNTSPGEIDDLYEDVKKEIEKSLFSLEKKEHFIKADVSLLSLGKKVILRNGIIVERFKDGFVISTPGNTYRVFDSQLVKETRLSEDLYLKKENGQLIFKLLLTTSVGGKDIFRDKENIDRSLPENEIGEFIRYTDQIRRIVSGFLGSWQRVKDNTGRVKLPRVVLLNGETGTAKTALMRNLAGLMGVPIYVLNAYADLKVSDISAGFKLAGDEVQIGLKEFLIRCGKINGQRRYLPSQVTSSRSILLIDEANASPEILYALMPLFRGEKKFTVEYAGESFEVEADDQIMVVLTFNPMEKYAGREGFSRAISFFADKLWAPNPQNYSRDVLVDILAELHRRGITSIETEKNKLEQAQAVYEEYIPAKVKTEEAKDLAHPEVSSITDWLLQMRTKKANTAQDGHNKERSKSLDNQIRDGIESISKERPGKNGLKNKIEYPYNINPALCRQGVYDEVNDLEMVSNSDNEEKITLDFGVSVPGHWKAIKADMNVNVDKNIPVLLTSPVPASMLKIISYKAVNDKQEEVKVKFLRGSKTDSLYIQADYQGMIKISFDVAIDKSAYFGNALNAEIDFDMPEQIPAVIKSVLTSADLGYNKDNYFKDKKEFIYALTKFFKNFGVQEDGIERKGKGDTVLEKIVSSRQGVCRQRAGAFFIITKYLGFNTRYVENQMHAFCEIYLKDYGWVRLDLGGGGDPAAMGFGPSSGLEEVEEAGDMPAADSEEALAFQEEYRKRKEEAESLANAGEDTEQEGETANQKSRIHKAGSGQGSSEGQVLEAGQNVGRNLAKLSSIAPNLVNMFLAIFSGEPKTFLEYSDSGDEMDIEKIIGQEMDPFFIKRIIQDVASLICGLTLDISGSVRGNNELFDSFNNMTAFYTSLFYYAAIRNKGLDFSLSAIGNDFHNLLNGPNCRELKAVEEALGSLKDVNDFGGINTVAVIKGIRQKYQGSENKKHKLEIVLTDGCETSGKSFAELKNMIDELEKELNIDIVFIGIKTKDVTNYSKFVMLNHNPSTRELIKLIMSVSLAKAARHKLPNGDLVDKLGLKFEDGGNKNRRDLLLYAVLNNIFTKLDDYNPLMRKAAVGLISDMAKASPGLLPEGIVKNLIDKLDDGNNSVKEAAISALTVIAKNKPELMLKITSILLKKLDFCPRDIQVLIINNLGEIAESAPVNTQEAIVKGILERLMNFDPVLQKVAAENLSRITAKTSLELLKKMLSYLLVNHNYIYGFHGGLEWVVILEIAKFHPELFTMDMISLVFDRLKDKFDEENGFRIAVLLEVSKGNSGLANDILTKINAMLNSNDLSEIRFLIMLKMSQIRPELLIQPAIDSLFNADIQKEINNPKFNDLHKIANQVLLKIAKSRPELISNPLIDYLFNALNNKDYLIRAAVVEILGQIRKTKPELTPQLLERFLNQSEVEPTLIVKELVIQILIDMARANPEFRKEIFERVLNKQNNNIFFKTKEGNLPSKESSAVLLEMASLSQESAQVVVNYLFKYYKESSSSWAEFDISLRTLTQIAQLNPGLAKDIYSRLLVIQQEDFLLPVREKQFSALADIAKSNPALADEIADYLLNQLDNKVPFIQIYSIAALGKIAIANQKLAPEIVKNITDKLDSTNQELQKGTIRVLGLIARDNLQSSQDITNKIFNKLDDPDYSVRKTVVEALREIAKLKNGLISQYMVSRIYDCLNDPDNEVQLAAIKTLSVILTTNSDIDLEKINEYRMQLLDPSGKFRLKEKDILYGYLILSLLSEEDCSLLAEFKGRAEEDFSKLLALTVSNISRGNKKEALEILRDNKDIKKIIRLLEEALFKKLDLNIYQPVRSWAALESWLTTGIYRPVFLYKILSHIVVTMRLLHQGIGEEANFRAQNEQIEQRIPLIRKKLIILLEKIEQPLFRKRLVKALALGNEDQIGALHTEAMKLAQVVTGDSDIREGLAGRIRENIHNCPSPQDLDVVKAYQVFLKSNNAAGLEKLGYKVEAADFIQENKKEAVLKVVQTLIDLLEDIYGEGSIAKAGKYYDDWQKQVSGQAELKAKIASLLNAPPEDNIIYLARIIEIRKALSNLTVNLTGEALLLSIILDNCLETIYYRKFNEINKVMDFKNPQAAITVISSLLENALLNGYSQEESGIVLAELNALRGKKYFGRTEWLDLYSKYKRIERIINESSVLTINDFQEIAQHIGNALGLQGDIWVENFSANLFRSDTIYLLSIALVEAKKTAVKEAGISGWQIVVPGQAKGRIRVIKELSELEKLNPEDIIVIDNLSSDAPPVTKVRAIITFKEDSLLSHQAIRSRQYNIPFAVCPDKSLLKDLDGQWVNFTILNEDEVILNIEEEKLSDKQELKDSALSKNIELIPADLGNKDFIVMPQDYKPELVGNKAFRLNKIPGNILPEQISPLHFSLSFSLFSSVMDLPVNSAIKLRILNLQQKLLEKPSAADITIILSQMRACIESLNIPQEYISGILGQAHAIFGPEAKVFLRSTTNAEDLVNYQAAGLYDSFGNINLTKQDLDKYIKKVWASIWNERAFYDRQIHNIDHAQVFPAVLIQEMVIPDYAFVVHTANPVNPDSDEVVIELVQGFGESLVSGMPEFEGAPYRFVYNRNSGKLQLTAFANKSRKLIIDGTGMKSVYASYRDDKLLTEELTKLVEYIAVGSVKIETVLGQPQDIEGAVLSQAGNWRLAFLQSRDLAMNGNKEDGGFKRVKEPTDDEIKQSLALWGDTINAAFYLSISEAQIKRRLYKEPLRSWWSKFKPERKEAIAGVLNSSKNIAEAAQKLQGMGLIIDKTQLRIWQRENKEYLRNSIQHESAKKQQLEDAGSKGGIDFSALPIVTQAISNLKVDISRMPLDRLEGIDLDRKFQELEKMVSAGMLPSAERIKEYIQVSCLKNKPKEYFDQAVLCIADIMRLQEDKCVVTNQVLKDILLVLESGIPDQELKIIFTGQN